MQYLPNSIKFRKITHIYTYTYAHIQGIIEKTYMEHTIIYKTII